MDKELKKIMEALPQVRLLVLLKLWQRGAVACGTIGELTQEDGNDAAQKTLLEMGRLWTRLGSELGLVTDEDRAALDGILKEMEK